MSRTRHHGNKAKLRLFEGAEWGVYLPAARGNRPKRKRHCANWYWLRTPGWWVRVMMTVPQRAKTRQILSSIKKMDDLEDAPFLPHPKKPHHYYW